MQYCKNTLLKDGRSCTIRNGTEQDGKALLDIFLLTHAQTDYLLSYPDEKRSICRRKPRPKTRSSCWLSWMAL